MDSCSLGLGGPILTYNWSIPLSFVPLDSLGRLRLTANYNVESTSISSGVVIKYNKQTLSDNTSPTRPLNLSTASKLGLFVFSGIIFGATLVLLFLVSQNMFEGWRKIRKQYQAVEMNEKHQDSSESRIKKEENAIKIAESMDDRLE